MSYRERRNRKMKTRHKWECPHCRQIFDLYKQPNIAEEHPSHCIELEKEEK